MVIMTKSKETTQESTDEVDDGRETVPKEILVIAQEVKIVRSLACNDVNKRNRQMRKLRKWLQLRARSSFAFTTEDFLRIWKGLYYNMWMSDKPLVQEELAEQLGQLLDCFDGDVEKSVEFFGAFMRTMCLEWFGIDQWRIDKFLMLVRRMLRYMFRVLKSAGWSETSIKLFSEHMQQSVLSRDTTAAGLTMHYFDIFCEELAKVTDGDINAEQVGAFVRPFVTFIATQHDFKLIAHCRSRIFVHLLYQSALGREYMEKYNAWKEMGFPTTSINELEKIETDSAHEEESMENGTEQVEQKHLDPRAGNVDVFMPELPLDAKYIIKELELYIYKNETSTKCRKSLKKLLAVFETYQQGEFPLGVKKMPRSELKSEKPLIKEKIIQLENLENEMYGVGRKLKQLNKRKRRKLLKSLNFDNVGEGDFDQVIEKALPKQYLKERRKKAKGTMLSGWLEEQIDNETETITAAVPITKKKQKQQKNNTTIVTDAEVESNNKTKQQQKNKQKRIVSNDDESEPAKKVKKNAKKVEAETEEGTAVDTATTGTNVKLDTITNTTAQPSEWDEPLEEGEVEYFISSRKLQLKKVNAALVRNPLAKQFATPTNAKQVASAGNTPASIKRVKIALKHNTAQNPSEYIRQIRSSPNLPYDANRKPGKGLLKPNSMPSPINPFYKKKIGLRLLNESI